jgi:hypothetical protein
LSVLRRPTFLSVPRDPFLDSNSPVAYITSG